MEQTTNRSSLIQQIQNHPFWRDGKEREIEPGNCSIVRKDDLNYCLIWFNQSGIKTSVPFQISGNGFFFKNGQGRRFSQINETINEIFKHF